MTTPNPPDKPHVPGQGAPIDDYDIAVLDRLKTVHDRVDPPPPLLDDLVRFAVDLTEVDAHVARLRREAPDEVSARSSTRTSTITFETDDVSILVTVTPVPGHPDRRRLDGWIAPARAATVELHYPDPEWGSVVAVEAEGGFAFADLPRGLVKITVRLDGGRPATLPDSPAVGAESAGSVERATSIVTPCFMI